MDITTRRNSFSTYLIRGPYHVYCVFRPVFRMRDVYCVFRPVFRMRDRVTWL